MEFRNLFDTDTDTLLNELSTGLDQTNQQQQQQTQQSQPTSQMINNTYSSQYQSSQSGIQPQMSQNMYHQTNMYPNQYMMQNPQQQSQQNYYSNQMMPNQNIKQQNQIPYMHPQMGHPNTGSNQPPPQPGAQTTPSQPQTQPNQTSTTIQNVQINVQNNFNIGKTIQQSNLNQYNTSSNVQMSANTTATTQQNWSQYSNSNQQYNKNVMMSPMQSQVPPNAKMGPQFSTTTKPSPPPTNLGTPQQPNPYNIMPVQQPQAINKPMVYSQQQQQQQQPQQVQSVVPNMNNKMMPQPTAHSNQMPNQYVYNQSMPSQQQQQNQKLSSIPPHMQPNQYNPNQNMNPNLNRLPQQSQTPTQPQTTPAQYQASPNKLPNQSQPTYQTQLQTNNNQSIVNNTQSQLSPNNGANPQQQQRTNYYTQPNMYQQAPTQQAPQQYYNPQNSYNSYANQNQNLLNTPTRVNFPNQNSQYTNNQNLDLNNQSQLQTNLTPNMASPSTNPDNSTNNSDPSNQTTPTKRGRGKSKSKTANSSSNSSPEQDNSDNSTKSKKRTSKNNSKTNLLDNQTATSTTPANNKPNLIDTSSSQSSPNIAGYPTQPQAQQQQVNPPNPYSNTNNYNMVANTSQSPSSINRTQLPPNQLIYTNNQNPQNPNNQSSTSIYQNKPVGLTAQQQQQQPYQMISQQPNQNMAYQPNQTPYNQMILNQPQQPIQTQQQQQQAPPGYPNQINMMNQMNMYNKPVGINPQQPMNQPMFPTQSGSLPQTQAPVQIQPKPTDPSSINLAPPPPPLQINHHTPALNQFNTSNNPNSLPYQQNSTVQPQIPYTTNGIMENSNTLVNNNNQNNNPTTTSHIGLTNQSIQPIQPQPVANLIPQPAQVQQQQQPTPLIPVQVNLNQNQTINGQINLVNQVNNFPTTQNQITMSPNLTQNLPQTQLTTDNKLNQNQTFTNIAPNTVETVHIQSATIIQQPLQPIQPQLNSIAPVQLTDQPTENKTQSPSNKKGKKGQNLDDSTQIKPVKPRKIRPKKGSNDTSLNTDSAAGENSADQNGLSASTHAKIEATIDDFMKKYKMKKDEDSESENDDEKEIYKKNANEEDDEGEEEEENDDDDYEDDDFKSKKKRKTKSPKSGAAKGKRAQKIKNLDSVDDDNDNENETQLDTSNTEVKKKRKYTKKKGLQSLKINQLDEQSISTLEQNDANNESQLTVNKLLVEDESMNNLTDTDQTINKKGRKTKPKDENMSPFITTSNSNRGRRKSALVKLMQKKRKKRKKTSSDEDGPSDDDSDDFELSAAVLSKNKKTEDSQATLSTASHEETNQQGDDTMNTDEATAKLLQANEKRRSTRTVKRQKYSDTDYKLKDEDLLLPVNDTDQVEEPTEVTNGNIVFASHESLIVDKILGIRLFKRKTKRKKEKKPKNEEHIEKQEVKKEENETKTETKTETKLENEEKQEKAEEKTDKVESDSNDKQDESKMDIDQSLNQPTVEIEKTDKSEEKSSELVSVEQPEQDSVEKKQDEVTKIDLDVKDETKIVPESDAKAEEDTKKDIKEDKEPIPDTETVQKDEKIKTETIENEKQQEKMEKENAEVEDEEESEYEEDGGEIEVEEYFVKYKSLSYLHCEWRTRDELFLSDKRIDQKIKRYRLKKQQSQVYDWDNEDQNNNGYNNDYDELFNPDYVVIDRILDEYEVDDPQKPGGKLKYFLIKWKACPYDEASWELESDVKNAKKIERFHKINTLVPEIHCKVAPKPKVDRWEKMNESRSYKNGNKLREYQLEGINWLTFCWLNGRNCILADEMGLGKTVQSITFLQEIANYGVQGPFLVLVPLSTIGNWIREFETWTDFNVIVYHGSTPSRQMLQDYEFYFKNSETSNNKKKIVKFNALITTYEVLMSDVPLFCQFKWRNCIIDEAHRLKNKNCKLIEGLRYMDVEHKVLLTGTPLQNNVEELFSLLNFLEPQQFHSSQEFMQEFGDLKTDTQVQKLQAVLKPMMLRRLKEDVEKNLKPKEETIVEVELTNTQKKYYRAILEKNFQFLTRGVSNANVPNLMNTMMELRKCCNHPYLIDGAEDNIIAEYSERFKSSDIQHEKVSLQAMVQASGKLVLVDKLLPKLKAGGHRVLIFSQMIRVLDILEDYLIQMRFTYERLDGRIRGEARQEAIDRYSKPDSDRFAFLLCTRAGGLGINLTAADTVIIYDSDWNPQNDLQAQARVHRIGQQKSVKIYRLITRNTYEREMFDRASLKLGLDKAILQSMRNEDKFNQSANNQTAQLSKKEIEDLLKKGAYGAIMEDDNAGDKFCEEDIDKILQQRSTVIQIEGGEKGSTFSKASFQTSETNDISIDDPEFWQKWAKKADIDIEEKLNPKDERIIYEPRRRTQTRRYGGPDDVMEESEYSSSDSDENKDKTGVPTDKDSKKRGKKRRGRPTGDDAPFKAYDNDNGNDLNDDEDSNVWSREECYKVEKLLLIYGWSRWSRILKNLEFSSKRKALVQTEQDVENLSRTIIAYTVKNYQGDESIKQFITELIDPSKSNFTDLKNHQGLAAPVARGRKPRAQTEIESNETTNQNTDLEWAKNAEELLGDENYKKHLIKQANKILLRIRMLFYIKSEIIGEEYSVKLDQDESDLTFESTDLQIPEVGIDLPADWWDKSCDVSLFIGVYKHGFEKYYQMRSDSKLCFLSICGPPDAKDLLAEQQQQQNEDNNDDNNEAIDVDDSTAVSKPKEETSQSTGTEKYKKFPTVSELNNRLRRMIASVQKYKKQEQMMSKRNAERQEKRLSKLASNQERAQARQIEKQSKWSRREEQNFYKAIASYGVDCIDKVNNVYAWDRFREIGQLDKKLDETLTDYYNSFIYMCKKVCNKLTDEDQPPVNEVPVEMISEERASRCIQRVELLNKIRHDVLKHEKFDEWISERCLPSSDLPDWYIPGKHDRELVQAAARYGITRSEYYYANDLDFTFKEYLGKYMRHIEELMDEDNSGLEPENRMIDPIQYYFQNQAKIQITFKEVLNKEIDSSKDAKEQHLTKSVDEEKEKKDEDTKDSDKEKEKKDSGKEKEKKEEGTKDSDKEKTSDENQEEKREEKNKEEKSDEDSEQKEPEKVVENNKETESQKEKTKEDEGEEEKIEDKSELIDTSQKELVIDEEKETEKPVESPKKEQDKEMEVEEDEKKENESAVEEQPKQSPKKNEKDEEKMMDIEEEKEKIDKKEENDLKVNIEKESELKQEDVSMKIDEDKENVEKVEEKKEIIESKDEESEKKETKEKKDENSEKKETEAENKEIKQELNEIVNKEENKSDLKQEPKPEPTNYFGANSIPMIMWPKDRVIYNRLENIIQLFESNGEWPQQRALFMYQQQMSTNGGLNGVASSTSLASITSNSQLPSNSLSISNLVHSSSNNLFAHHQLLAEQRKMMMSPMLNDNCSVDEDDDNLSVQDNDPDYYSKTPLSNSDSKYQKPKRGRPPKFELPLGISPASATAIPADPAHKIRNLLNNSPSTSKFREELDSIDENSILSKSEQSNKFLEPGEIFRPKSSNRSKFSNQQNDSENSDASSSSSTFSTGLSKSSSNNNSNKRGRKSTTGKEQISVNSAVQPAMNPNDLAALAALFVAPGQDPDERITVINMEDGTRLTGSKAPKRIDLPIWLLAHPNYLPDEQEIINMTLKNSTLAALQQQQQQQQQQQVNIEQSKISQSNKKLTSKQVQKQDHGLNSPSSVDHDFEQDQSPSRPSSTNSSIINQRSYKDNQSRTNTPTQSVNSDQQLILYNKVSQKRLNSAKVPPFKHLNSFLEKNEQLYIDPSCNDLIRSKFGKNIPETIKSRMINKNKQRPNSSPSPSPASTPKPNGVNNNNNNNNNNNSKKPVNNSKSTSSQSQQQSQQPPLFNQFSPNSTAQLQGLSELLGATGGVDFNNPLISSFMAAALAGQGGAPPGLPGFGSATNFNPFLLPPFAPSLPGTSGTSAPPFNPLIADLLKDMGNKLPPGLDMGSFDELTASLLALQHQQGGLSQSTSGANSPALKSSNDSKQKDSNSKSTNNSNNNGSSSSNSLKTKHDQNDQLKKKQQQLPHSSSSNNNSNNREKEKSSNQNSNQRDSKAHPGSSSSPAVSSKNSIESKLNSKETLINKKTTENSSKNLSHKESKSSASTSQQSLQQQPPMDFASLAAAMQGLDPTNPANIAALASMMEQEKFLQEMMNLSQFGSAGAAFSNNPFLFGPTGSPFTPPTSLPSSSHLPKSSRARSPSPNADRDHSISPALSVASNLSTQQQPNDFNLLMNNLMNCQLLGAGAGAMPPGLPPFPPLGGFPGDLSKLPVDLLAALAGQPGALGGLDPNMFSALAQLNSLSNNVANEDIKSKSGLSGSKSMSKAGSSSSSKTPNQSKTPMNQSKPMSKTSGQLSSSSSSQNQISKKPRLGSDNLDDSYQGLDLSIKKSSSSNSRTKSSSRDQD